MSNFQKIQVKSIPRSGIHFLKNSLEKIFNESYTFCEFYYEPGCCKKIPCALNAELEKRIPKDIFYLRMMKSHDFDLTDEMTSKDESTSTLVLFRDPLEVLTSWFELDELTRHKDKLLKSNINMDKIFYRHEPLLIKIAVDAMDQEYLSPTQDDVQKWLDGKAKYITAFYKKWVQPKENQLENKIIVINYKDIPSYIDTLIEISKPYFSEIRVQSMKSALEIVKMGFEPKTDPFTAKSSAVRNQLNIHKHLFIDTAKNISDEIQRLLEFSDLGQKKKLLCIPLGGLNDTLCQIEKCRQYATKHNRELLLDTTKSGLMCDFPSIFKFKNKDDLIIEKTSQEDYSSLNKLQTNPAEVQGRVDGISFMFSMEKRAHCDLETGVPLSFDFSKNHYEDLLIHQDAGGGNLSHSLLPLLELTKDLREKVIEALKPLPENYVAVHIRNTDYKTEYRDFFDSLKPKLEGKNVLICSDNAEIIDNARIFFSDSNILSAGDPLPRHQKPLHYKSNYSTDAECFSATQKSIIDLIALASADELYYTKITDGFSSGFSQLAEYLNKNKNLINALLKN